MSRDRFAISGQHGLPGAENDRILSRLAADGEDPLTSSEGCPDCAGTGVNTTAANPAAGCGSCDGTGWRP